MKEWAKIKNTTPKPTGHAFGNVETWQGNESPAIRPHRLKP